MPTESQRIVRLAIAIAMTLTLFGPVLDASAAADLYPGAPAVVASQSAPFASIKATPDPTASELIQIDNGIPATIVAGPMPGTDGLLWYQIEAAGLIGYIAETDLAWGAPAAPEPAPVETQPVLIVTGTGVVLAEDTSEIACRIEPMDTAAILFTYASGSTVDLAGAPFDGWQPVICAGQFGYVPARFVFDPANLPLPEPTEIATEPIEIPEIPEVATEIATEIVPGVDEIIDLPEITETIAIDDESPIPATIEPTQTETTDPPAASTGTPEAAETPEPVATTVDESETIEETATPAVIATTVDSSETPVPSTTPGTVVPSETPTVAATPEDIVEVVAATEPVGQTIRDGDAPVSAAALASAAAVYNTGAGGLRCRVAPSLEAQVLLVLPLGAPVSLTGWASNGWQPVKCNGQNGFVAVRFLQPTDGGTIEQEPASPGGSSSGSSLTVQNTEGAGLRCRSAANLTASIIAVLPEGTTLVARGNASNGWQPVTCAGSAGWVSTDFVGSQTTGGTGGTGGNGSGSTTTGSATVANTGGDGVRLRAGASFDSAVIAVLTEGAALTLRSGSTGGWTAVIYDGRNGFIYSDYVATLRNPSTPGSGSGVGSTSLSSGSNARVTESLNFRSAAAYSAGVVGIAPVGTVVRVTGAASGGFYPVNWAGTTGYMHGDYLVYTTEALSTTGPNGAIGGNTGGGAGAGSGQGSARGQAMIDYAMRYLGYPYIWATHGPNSFDCSGFTYWVVLNIAGKDIGAGTWTQWESGSPVQYGSLQPGDLVFFQNTYTVGLSHVGMYIGGDQFIHAENENTGVRISSLTSTYYATRYLGARRI